MGLAAGWFGNKNDGSHLAILVKMKYSTHNYSHRISLISKYFEVTCSLGYGNKQLCLTSVLVFPHNYIYRWWTSRSLAKTWKCCHPLSEVGGVVCPC